MARTNARWWALVVVPLLWPGDVPAQIVRGRVTAAEGGAPVQGAFVRLLDAGGRQRTAVLTDALGRYRLRSPEPGTYRLRAEFIGRAAAESGLLSLAAGDALDWSPALAVRPVGLDAIEVEGSRRCTVRPEEGTQVAAVWERARQALEVADWALDQELFRYEIVHYRRELEGEGRRVVDETRERREGTYRRPFASRPASELMRDGFVRETADGTFADAPDARVLLADEFLDAHCFRLRRDEEGRVGIAFEPVRGREVPDIEGVMWLDRRGEELRSVAYRYVGLPDVQEEARGGGRIEFERLPGGAWIVRRWSVELPILGEVERRGVVNARGPEVVGFMEEGGQVLRAVDRDGRAVLAADGATLAGMVFDSIRGGPLEGARIRVVGTDHETATGSDGSFLLGGLPGGTYRVVVAHPRLDSLGVAPPTVSAELTEGTTTRVALGLPTSVEGEPGSTPGIRGELLEASGEAAVSGALVSLVVDGEGEPRARTVTDERGAYVLEAPAPGAYRVRVERPGWRPMESGTLRLDGAERRLQSLRFAAGRVELARVALDGPTPCVPAPGGASATGRVWAGVRAALWTAVSVGEREDIGYRITVHQRERWSDGRVRRSSEPVAGLVRHAFGEVPGATEGLPVFVEATDTGLVAATPGPRYLVSDGFAERYCLGLAPGPEGPGSLALVFEPGDDRGGRPDVRGLVVVDRSTGLPRSLHYRHVAFPGPAGPAAPGGWMTFGRLPGGALFAREWERRLPLRGMLQDPERPAAAEPFAAGSLVRGGYVDEARAVDGEVLWDRGSGEPGDSLAARMWQVGDALGGPEEVRPVRLDPLDVAVEGRSPRLAQRGFYDRQVHGVAAAHLDRKRIEERVGARRLSDLLRGLPGLTVVHTGRAGASIVRVRRASGDQLRARVAIRGCEPNVYLDGVLQFDRLNPPAGEPRLRDVNVVSPDVVEGIEAYTGATAPAGYRSDGCGVVLIWTRS